MGLARPRAPPPLPTACPDAIDAARVGAAKEFAVKIRFSHARRFVSAVSLLVCGSLFSVSNAFADDAAVDLDQIVVTATRTAQTQDQTLAAVSIIDRAEIERLQARTLADLLADTPGISIVNNGGLGKQTSVFVRGTESDHVLVLVDGIKLGSATAGAAAIQDIPVDQIERIEIVRGPFSSLYGSEAIGGVIQIFTRQPAGTFVPSFSAGIGSYDTVRAAAGVGGHGTDGWYSVEAAHERTDGINACRGRPFPDGAGCFVDEPDRDGYRNSSLSFKGGYRFDEAWSADARAFRAEGDNHYDGSSSNESETVSQTLGATLHYKPTSAIALTFGLGQSADLSDDYLDGVYQDTFNSHHDLATLQGDFAIGGGLVSVGYDWQRDRVDSSTVYALDHRIDDGLFAQWQRTFGAQSLQVSVRHDDNSQFGGKTTGSALWGWDFTDALRLTASAGTAFKAPTFNELYYPDYGNANLRPETSRNFELGLRGKTAWGGWSLAAFQNTLDNLIVYDPSLIDDAHPFGGPNNVDSARIRGVEASADTEIAGWTLRANATWLDPRNEGSDDGKILPRRARLTAGLDADRAFGDFSVGASLHAFDHRYDDLANTTPLGGYALTDLRFAYALTKAWKLELSANNLFDRRYETAAFYNQPGRNFMLSARYRPAD